MGAGASRGEDARNARAAGLGAPYRGGLFQQQPLQPQQSHQPPPHQRPYAAQQQPHAQQQPPAQRAAVVTQQQHVRTADATIPRRGDPSPRRVSSLTDELLKCKAKLELAEAAFTSEASQAKEKPHYALSSPSATSERSATGGGGDGDGHDGNGQESPAYDI